MTVGGVDTYYDYEEKQWKSRRLGGGPIRRGPVCPAPRTADHTLHERHLASAIRPAASTTSPRPSSAERPVAGPARSGHRTHSISATTAAVEPEPDGRCGLPVCHSHGDP